MLTVVSYCDAPPTAILVCYWYVGTHGPLFGTQHRWTMSRGQDNTIVVLLQLLNIPNNRASLAFMC